MKKNLFYAAAGILAAVFLIIAGPALSDEATGCGMKAFAGTWVQEKSRADNQSGVTNWWWRNSDGTYPAGRWAWIDGDGDGVAECYYFNADGYMLASSVTPDNYTVDGSGAWVKDGTVQKFPNEWVPGGNVLTSDKAGRSATENRINPTSNGISSDQATYSDMSDDEAYKKLMQIKSEVPDGTSWDNTKLYVSGYRYGYGCAGFAFMVQDRLFGSPAMPVTDNTFDMSELRVGDHLRLDGNTHSVIVLTKGSGYITVAEGNYNKAVHWGRRISESELKAGFAYRETCYR